jgi:hypothetical protein
MLRSRWVEGEVLRLQRLGFSYEAIAQQITEIGRRQRWPVTPFPEDLTFPLHYKITALGAIRLSAELKRTPTIEAKEMHRLDTDRCEDMFLSLAPAIQKGEPQAVRAAVQVLALKAGINGYKSSEMEVKVAPGPSWSTTLTKDQTVSLFKEAMTLLIESEIRIEEMTRVAGLKVPAIEVSATKTKEDNRWTASVMPTCSMVTLSFRWVPLRMTMWSA